MAKVLGIGGVFFKSRDPQAIADWYQKWLGFDIQESFGGTIFTPGTVPKGGYTIWSPFNADSRYFEPGPNNYMINLMVDDLTAALDQVQAGGAEVMTESESSEYGDFGWFIDPDGNKVELWQPADELPED